MCYTRLFGCDPINIMSTVTIPQQYVPPVTCIEHVNQYDFTYRYPHRVVPFMKCPSPLVLIHHRLKVGGELSVSSDETLHFVQPEGAHGQPNLEGSELASQRDLMRRICNSSTLLEALPKNN